MNALEQTTKVTLHNYVTELWKTVFQLRCNMQKVIKFQTELCCYGADISDTILTNLKEAKCINDELFGMTIPENMNAVKFDIHLNRRGCYSDASIGETLVHIYKIQCLITHLTDFLCIIIPQGVQLCDVYKFSTSTNDTQYVSVPNVIERRSTSMLDNCGVSINILRSLEKTITELSTSCLNSVMVNAARDYVRECLDSAKDDLNAKKAMDQLSVILDISTNGSTFTTEYYFEPLHINPAFMVDPKEQK